MGDAVRTTATVGTITLFNPAFLKVWAAAKGLNESCKLIEAKLSRMMEYQADRGAVEILEANPLALITALRKIEALMERSSINALGYNAREEEKNPLLREWRRLKRTHPKTDKRILRLAKIAFNSGQYSADEIDEAVFGDLHIDDMPDVDHEMIQTMAKQIVPMEEPEEEAEPGLKLFAA